MMPSIAPLDDVESPELGGGGAYGYPPEGSFTGGGGWGMRA